MPRAAGTRTGACVVDVILLMINSLFNTYSVYIYVRIDRGIRSNYTGRIKKSELLLI